MTDYKGWNGYYTLNGNNFGGTINSWSLDESVGEVDVSAFDATSQDTRNREYEPGLKEATASISGFADLTDSGQQAVKDSLDNGTKYMSYFYLQNGTYYAAQAFVTSRTTDHNFDDSVAEISVDFRITGDINEFNI